jgi:conjugal transfer pilus assembly protein TraF
MNPSANFAQVELRQARTEAKRRTMESLARDFGIVFFFRSDCPYCKIQAPVLRMLSNTYGMEVLPVSLDGGPLDGWPEARVDNGISMVVSGGRGVNVVPALYLVSRDTRQAVMLGSGVLAADEIVDRVHLLTQVPVGEDVGGGIR